MISNGALVSITLMIAESRPEEKDIMIAFFDESLGSKALIEL